VGDLAPDLLGAIELRSVPLSDPPAQAVADAIREAVASEGITLFAWSEAATALRDRLDFLHRALGDPWPDVSDAALTQTLQSWLGPQLARVRSAQDLRRVDVATALRAMVPWPQAGRLDNLAPERVQVPSGSSVRIDYSAEQPVLAVRIQEVFVWTAAPALADGRVPLLLHLLSPRDARQPSRQTWSPSGTTATPVFVLICAVATPSTPGRRIPGAHQPPRVRTIPAAECERRVDSPGG
jgi:ATP-dependent helicase HrpB